MKKVKTSNIYKTFRKEDEATIIRKINLRMYCKNVNIKCTKCKHGWLIDFEDLMRKLNPKDYTERKTLPRIRTKKTSIEEWNITHRKKIKHHIIDCICDSGKIFVYRHGGRNIINYDELEQELIKILKEKGKY